MQIENLKSYLANINMSIKNFAEIIDCQPSHLYQILCGNCYAGERLARDIYNATGGIIIMPVNPKKTQKRQKKEKQSKNA